MVREVQDGSGSLQGNVRAIRQTQEAESAGLSRFQLAVAEFEGGLDGEVARLEFVQTAALVRQLRGQVLSTIL
ncbi:hypothetical protein ACWD8L_35295 [Streptomyces sp. NPDC005133]|uniref:hypothetical protein n=1 Tax=unclassified Streptomyces TaxID=2593676 RepID=UPI0033AB6772